MLKKFTTQWVAVAVTHLTCILEIWILTSHSVWGFLLILWIPLGKHIDSTGIGPWYGPQKYTTCSTAVRTVIHWGLEGLGIKSCPEWPWGLPAFLQNEYWVSWPQIKGLGSGSYHSPPTSIKVKEECSYASNAPLGLHGLFQGELHSTSYLHVKQK
jgi:hypothetical protein